MLEANFREHEYIRGQVTTDRDLAMMRLIGTDGLSRFKILHSQFWPAVQAKACREQLRKREKWGWLNSQFIDTPFGKGELIFTLTNEAAKEFFTRLERRFFITKLPAPNEIHQQLVAQQARLVLEKELGKEGLEIIGWQNERQLRSQARLHRYPGMRAAGGLAAVADACAIVLDPVTGERFERFIEVDGQYYGQMLRKKIASILIRKQPTIWATTPGRVELISAATGQAGTDASKLIQIMVVEEV